MEVNKAEILLLIVKAKQANKQTKKKKTTENEEHQIHCFVYSEGKEQWKWDQVRLFVTMLFLLSFFFPEPLSLNL